MDAEDSGDILRSEAVGDRALVMDMALVDEQQLAAVLQRHIEVVHHKEYRLLLLAVDGAEEFEDFEKVGIGDEVEVLQADGKKLTGVLKSVEGRQFVVTTKEKQVPEGKKRPVLVEVDKELSMDEVKYTKYLLAFK